MTAGVPVDTTEPAPPARVRPDNHNTIRIRPLFVIELVDELDNPVPYRRFRVTDPDGSTLVGRLDENGQARVWSTNNTPCKITFLDIDARAWEPIEDD